MSNAEMIEERIRDRMARRRYLFMHPRLTFCARRRRKEIDDLKARVDKLSHELHEFVRSTIESHDFDVVIPIIRKGLFILKTSNVTMDPSCKTYLLPLREGISLKGKKVLILDDSCLTGETLSKALRELKLNSLEKGLTEIAVFVKCKSCNVKWELRDASIDHLKHELEKDEYSKYLAIFDAYALSLCLQLDADHLVFNARVKSPVAWGEKSRDIFLTSLEKAVTRYGPFYYQKSAEAVWELWGRRKFAVVDLSAKEFGLEKLSSFWREEGVFKVRFCLEPDGRLCIAPIFCPEIVSNTSDCKRLLPWKLCELLGLETSSILCRDCAIFNLHILLSKNFLRKLHDGLQESRSDIFVGNSTWSELEARYENFTERVLKAATGDA